MGSPAVTVLVDAYARQVLSVLAALSPVAFAVRDSRKPPQWRADRKRVAATRTACTWSLQPIPAVSPVPEDCFGNLCLCRVLHSPSDIPNFPYSMSGDASDDIDRAQLARSDAVTEVSRIGFVGTPGEVVIWPSENGYGTVMYPACSWRALTIGNIRATDVIEPAGYHFMLQTCAKALLERKHAENMLTRDKEWICGSTQVEHRYVLMKSSLGARTSARSCFVPHYSYSYRQAAGSP